jgi:hypothetical protein
MPGFGRMTAHTERIHPTVSRRNRRDAACHPADCGREVDSSIGLGTGHDAGPLYDKKVYLPRTHPIYLRHRLQTLGGDARAIFKNASPAKPDCWMGCSRQLSSSMSDHLDARWRPSSPQSK